MKSLPNDIVLRPRFHIELSETKDDVLHAFDSVEKEPFMVKRLDEHIFIKFNKAHSHFWSPQLHLEIDEIAVVKTKVYGTFGPNPALWTFFMFLHFGVATIFILLGIWAYSSASLDKPYSVQLVMMVFMIVVWFTLYFFGRAGKRKGKPQMQKLYEFMQEVLS